MSVGEKIRTVTCEISSESNVAITFYRCTLSDGEPTALECEAVRWVSASELAFVDMPEADAGVAMAMNARGAPRQRG